jgi:ribonuclease R
MKQAVYTAEHEGHYALASDDYCHFTSPIRRYPDLQVHRQLVALLEGKRPRSNPDELAVLGEHCTRTERRAEAAERELIRIKLLHHLERRIGEAFHAIVVGVEDFGLFCRLVELPVEGLVHVTSLAGDFYYLEAGTHTLVGRRSGRRHRLGDRIEVRVSHVDIDRRELDLVLSSTPRMLGPRNQGPTAAPIATSLSARGTTHDSRRAVKGDKPGSLAGSVGKRRDSAGKKKGKKTPGPRKAGKKRKQ